MRRKLSPGQRRRHDRIVAARQTQLISLLSKRSRAREVLASLGIANDRSKYMLICGYCLLPTNAEASVTIGDSEVPLCNDKDVTCYELVTVYGRPLADGRRVGNYTKTQGQLRIDYVCPPGTGCELSQNGPCTGHWPTDGSD